MLDHDTFYVTDDDELPQIDFDDLDGSWHRMAEWAIPRVNLEIARMLLEDPDNERKTILTLQMRGTDALYAEVLIKMLWKSMELAVNGGDHRELNAMLFDFPDTGPSFAFGRGIRMPDGFRAIRPIRWEGWPEYHRS